MPGFCAVMLAKAERIAAGSFSRFLWVICVLSLYHEKKYSHKSHKHKHRHQVFRPQGRG